MQLKVSLNIERLYSVGALELIFGTFKVISELIGRGLIGVKVTIKSVSV